MLTLVLTLAMLLSVMVVGAGAATFGDQDSITNKEAVDVCTTLNIIGGYEDGTFRPAGNVTRAEMSKMICVALNGGKEPTMGSGLIATFNDVATSDWSAPYIEYCVSQGIVGGVGGGCFNPTGNITGTQAAKMLLCILGYNASIQGYVGDDYWETNINVDAAQKHLYDGLESIDASAPLTRDQAAQMIWNALQAYEVEYVTTLVTGPNGELTSKVTVQDKIGNESLKTKISLLSDKYDADINVGTLTSVDGSNLNITMSTADKAESDTTDEAFTKLSVDYSDLMGQRVKVVFKSGKTNDVLGVYATEDNTVYSTVVNAVDRDGDKLDFGGNTYSIETAGVEVYIDGVHQTTTAGAPPVTTPVKVPVGNFANSSSVEIIAGLGYNDRSPNFIKFVDSDDNGKIDTALISTVALVKVTYASSTEVIAGGVSYKHEDDNIASDIAKDDYVVVTKNLFDECNDIVKATKVSGSVGGYRDNGGAGINSGDEFMIDGQWYVVNAANATDMNSIQVGNDVDAWVYNGIVAYAKRTAGASSSLNDVCVITAIGTTFDGDKVKIRTFDGTEETVTYDDEDHSGGGSRYVAPNALETGVAYEYEVVKGEYRFLTLSTNDDWYGENTALNVSSNNYIVNGSGATSGKVNTVGATSGGTGGAIVADSAKVILVYDSNSGSTTNNVSTKVITGKQLQSLTIGSSTGNVSSTGTIAAFTAKVDGVTRATYAVVSVNQIPSEFSTNDNYGYITSSAYASGTGYIAYEVWTGSGDKSVPVVEKKSSVANRTKGTVIGYSSIDNGEISDVTTKGINSFTLNEGAIRGLNENNTKVSFDGETQYDITNDTVILYVDTKGHEGKVNGSIELATQYGSAYANNAMYITDGTDLALLIVDPAGKLYDKVTLSGSSLNAADINTALASGDVTVTGTLPGSGISVPADRTLTVSAAQTIASLEAVAADKGAKLVLSANSSDAYSGSASTKFYTAVGDAVADTNNIPLGTYEYKDADSTTPDDQLAWVKI